MFHIPEYHDEDAFPVEERDLPDHKLNWRGIAGEGKEPDSSADRGTTRTELQGLQLELRHRIRSDPPLPESEPPDEVGTFRGRSQSAPPILWAAQRYGRELRRMSDEFHGALQKLPRPKSAGTASQMFRTSGWKETLHSWWRRSSPGLPRSPP
uniref:bcl2-associated agonist of cell death n=1 Tax=Euleptes europaea TaxID=460621 RepID=UPI00254197DB|nr:bcl2-associated agonist of cell death [Euleptes europaea]